MITDLAGVREPERAVPPQRDLPVDFADQLLQHGYGPFFGTPCGVLAPLLTALEDRTGLLTIPREDNAVGVAAGASLAGRTPVVLMQNSGLGQSVNALASLVVPYRIPMLLIVSLRGHAPDTTQENLGMGRLTEPILAELGIPTERLTRERDLGALMEWADDRIRHSRGTAAVLIGPAAFGWQVAA
ncbi:thiamine pyrophosphate-binding protein [Streptacidiphilus jiangxiensis]|uniref:Phosphonopyruvate decarboxylase n=1 Tax=Streptacidiphilus jiangxiensis TaxID=235985 RepID=A0A1H7XMB1_STRJI|nr:thiamine pyrophosphate-binding protein [Streptacidiphilus jiangxiensis]SEM34764.1 phosphonopyruvate decarboxylase [Streptacidiphilus jiangxiensis]